MAVDRTALVAALEVHGDVVYCDTNNDISYVIVCNNWTADLTTFSSIADAYVIQDYPVVTALTLVNQVIKSEYDVLS